MAKKESKFNVEGVELCGSCHGTGIVSDGFIEYKEYYLATWVVFFIPMYFLFVCLYRPNEVIPIKSIVVVFFGRQFRIYEQM